MGYEQGLSWPFRCGSWLEGLTSVVVFFLLLGLTTFPILAILISMEDPGVEILLLSILLFLVIAADYAMSQLCFIAIAPSISHTVAQRYNPVSYLSVIIIAAVLYYAVVLIGAGFLNQK